MLVLRHGLRRKRLGGVWRRVFAGFKPKVLESPQTAFFEFCVRITLNLKKKN